MRLKTLVRGLLLAGFASSALAQAEQRVEITGSSIKRIAGEGALPVQVIRTEEIEREGITTAEQLVNFLSTNGTGLDNLASNADVVGGAQRGNNGLSAANLRGQGSTNTLVLLNGRRIAAHGLSGSAVDLNQIPLSAVDRVEILKDGASAIYGTDAIGGVINFILRKNFSGLRVQGFADVTEAGGGNIFRTSLVGGFGNLERDGWNVLATLALSDNKALRGNERDFVNTFQPQKGLSVDTRGTPHATILPLGASGPTTINPFTPNGTLINAAGTAPLFPGTNIRASGGINLLDLPGGAGCNAVDGMQPYDDLLWDFPQARLACAWDTGRAAVLQQPVKSTNFVGRGSIKLGEHLLSMELLGAKTESAKRFSNLQMIPNTTTQNFAYPRNANTAATYDEIIRRLVATFPADTLLADRGNPNRPGGALPISYRWRCIECGVREIKTVADTGRFFLGSEGPFFGWDYRTGVSQAFSKAESQLGTGYYYRNTIRDAAGNISSVGIVDVLNSGLLNPFLLPGQTQNPAGIAELAKASASGVVLYGGKYTTSQADFSVSGSLFKLGGGDAMAAVGADFRQEKYQFNGDRRAAQARPVIIAAPFDDANALAEVKRDVKAFYAELLLPVFKGFETTLAVRTDDYTGFGRTTNPKVSALWKPNAQFLLRGSYNEGFRVPNFNQLYNGITRSPYSGRDLSDPGKCPGGRPNSAVAGCEVIQPETVNGGKPDLGPETSKQATIGFVIEPAPEFSIGMDWWSIKRSNVIQLLDLRVLVNNYNLFIDRFIRDPAGNLAIIDQRLTNAGESETEGVEINLRSRGKMLSGSWSAGADATYLVKKRSRTLVNQPFGPSEIGVFSFAGDLGLRWKRNAFFTYTQGDWSGTVSTIYRSGYLNQELPGVTSGLVNPPGLEKNVRSYSTYSLSLKYSGIKNLSLTAGVKNIFDNDPPFAVTYDSVGGSGSSWEPRVADPRGRAYTLLVEYRFF